MKKLGLLIVGGVAAIILLHTIGPMIGLLIGLGLLYYIFKKFLKTKSTGKKIFLVIIGFIVLNAIFHHIPAIMAVGAAFVLYLVYKEWNETKVETRKEDNDSFVNFEKQWNEIVK
ncbi:lmo0954 family membrane protein [Neobacillus sp. D3-1R]|uniref:lmo0954 family membrane protein n=1 Tax=Neobacillus sp. D3-1R TaxID=3445778 RepID=UPI003F9F5668